MGNIMSLYFEKELPEFKRKKTYNVYLDKLNNLTEKQIVAIYLIKTDEKDIKKFHRLHFAKIMKIKKENNKFKLHLKKIKTEIAHKLKVKLARG